MKTAIISLLPLAGLALAKSSCKAKVHTSTAYVYENVSVSPVASPVGANKQDAPVSKPAVTPKPSSVCSRRTVTKTEIEKVTVTVDAEAAEVPVKTVDVTSTSTLHITTTITVRPTPSASVLPSSLHWGNFPNATYHSSAASVKPTSTLPDFELATPSNEAAVPSYPAEQPESVPSTETPSNETPAEPAAGASAAGSKQGEATFYGGNTAGGMCSFTGYTIPSGVFGTALSDSNWDGAGACGQCVSVTGPDGNNITAMVTDQCPGCGPNHVDLYPDAFAKLADPSKGIIKVSWDFVPCGITSPLVLKNKEGTSKHWFSMQVMNANVKVSKLEVSTDGGSTWKATTRQPYNYFENSSGFGTDSVDVKVTGSNGKSVIVKGVSVAPSTTKTAGGNL